MDPRTITSRRNPLVQEFRRVLQGKDEERLIVEGPRLLREAIEAEIEIESVLRVEGSGGIEISGATVFVVTPEVLAAASDTPSPQGVVALAKIPRHAPSDLLGAPHPRIVVAAGIQNAGNLGAIARAAEAFGATGLVTLRESARLFRPATLRGAMGSLFRLPAIEGLHLDEFLELLEKYPVRLVALDAKGRVPLDEADLSPPMALVLGSETHGTPEALRERASLLVSIPIRAPVESLGVSHAAAIALYEMSRRAASLEKPT